MSQNISLSDKRFARIVLRAPKMGERRWGMGGYGLKAGGWQEALSLFGSSRGVRLVAVVLGILGLVTSGQAQITVSRNFSVNQDIADRGQYVSGFQIANAGLVTINDVDVGLNLGSASSSTMRLGQMYATVTVGTASEGSRTAVLLNREGVSNGNAFGSSLSFLNVIFDDSTATNIYNLTGGMGTYAADGRIGVDPYGTRVAYDSSQVTAGLSALNGDWRDNWSLLVADTQAGNRAKLNSWSLSITGTAASTGTMDVGLGGTISASGNGGNGGLIGATVLSSGTGANAVSLAASAGQVLDLAGGISGSGEFKKTGNGVIRIGDSSGFTGTLQVDGGKAVVNGTMNSTSTLVVGSGATVGGTGTVGALQVASGGTIGPGNSPGQLNVARNATWAGGASYEWEINNFLGSAGTNWDFLNIAGELNITATSGSKFLVDVVSLLANNSPGIAAGFNAFTNYSFDIATAAGGITGFDAAAFVLDTSGFANPMWPTGAASGGSWSLSQSGNNIRLNYAAAIPEPNSATLSLLGLAAVLAKRRRFRG